MAGGANSFAQGAPRYVRQMNSGLRSGYNVIGERLDKPRKVRLKGAEACRLLERGFVHIEPPVDLDLQTVPALMGAAVLAYELDALVGIVDGDFVAHARKRPGNEGREVRLAC